MKFERNGKEIANLIPNFDPPNALDYVERMIDLGVKGKTAKPLKTVIDETTVVKKFHNCFVKV